MQSQLFYIDSSPNFAPFENEMGKSRQNVMELLELEARYNIKASSGEHTIGFSIIVERNNSNWKFRFAIIVDKELDLNSYLQRKYL